MTTKQQAEQLAAKLGVTLEVCGGRHFTVEINAPEGKRFLSHGGIHSLICEADGKAQMAWQMALDDLRQVQLEDCPEDCECKE